jgi:hypothetical protein
MKQGGITSIACWALATVTLWTGIAIARAADAPEAPSAKPPALCKEAIVNPVSGYAECVRPLGAPVDPPPPRPTVVKLAVFDFELEDATPASALLGQTTRTEATMGEVSDAARRMLAESGRYILADMTSVEAEPVRSKSLRNCDGCEAGIALQSGADQALIGVVRRITQTDYYVVIRITDAKTGKVLDEQAANFAGGPEGWASGVRMLIKHQILMPPDGT